ncbi:(Fe-S)-binding protein [Aurantimonas sp. VKM B-3413]|uniref:(Fe-S)-binding protein n=1 Tax=Aurantimonas sp. VKM B-3413 TaxID=2779401 RepID=UPI001E30AA8D|nr:(Fe-S)-binding protein [Aurantimonas sp. VKM B-3413]MCB8838375.1 (Fe-S)-binding protein [Aurantimonas sp. VKM B-3413]
MTAAAFLPYLILVMLAVAAVQIGRRVRVWNKGRPAKVDWIAGLKALPARYLVDVHHVVDRDKSASRMHVPVAAGLVSACGLSLLALIPVLGQSRLFMALVAIAFALMLAGALLVARRRYPEPMPRLSLGRFQRLPVYLLAFAAGGCLTAALAAIGNPLPLPSFLTLILAAAGGLMLATEVATGPMRHALAGATHLAAHPRPERFAAGEPKGRSTGLKPLDLAADKLGAEAPADFAWNRLLAFDACIQCGRCEAACPAFAAGQPLSPKHLIADFAAAGAGGRATFYAGMPYPNARPVTGACGPQRPIIGAGAVVHPDTIWSCTTCRACVEECPMMIEHVDAIVDLRRFQTLETGAIPPKAIEPLDNTRGCDEPNGRALAARTDFAAGLGLPLMRDVAETDLLLWLGQGAYDMRYQRTLRALIRLLSEAGVSFAVLGEEERDCGDLARRLGDEATFQRLARDNVATLSGYRFGRILTADPHALHVIRNEYPAFGGKFEVVHHTALLAELVAAGRLAPGRLEGAAVTYHDPCYLGRYNGEFDAPRELLDAIGVERREMARSGRRAMCCGGGGGAPNADIPGDNRIPDLRMGQAAETGAGIVAVACPQCTAMLEGVVGTRPQVLDVAELVLQAVEAGRSAMPAKPAPAERVPA